ncbi:FAD-dependent oxidoreductase [Caloranaerobacter azorensis H53214]|uniref:FAD-dependent oxidoreductase n=1 Tax=Caloranaerobacter azorensis H53214 TaxID=1156417 RepID=A0A096CWJ5_9FIRM|nr:NAD(P)/FAD-dependent oxidoreductase [Caloranaerobacter azorensis]KGG80944.1 FAD-dependent oxidoreductase [Caloranaerobacter azorensis H53214]
MYDIAVIGAGIIGTFIARELSKYKLNIILIEKNNDVADGTTKANSAIVHAGYDAKPGTNMAKFNSKGNPMFDKICEELDVEFKRVGSLVIAFNDEDMNTIKELYDRGLKNGIPNMEIISGQKVREMEPNLNSDIVGALYAPTCGIVGPWELAIALAENAVENGVELLLNSEVYNIDKTDFGYRIFTKRKVIDAEYVVNCAGLYADEINNMVASPYFKIKPRRGQYFILDKSAGNFVNRVIFQCPTKLGKGVLVAPTIHGNLIIGPDAEDLDDKERLDTTADRLQYVRKTATKTSKNIPFKKVITTFAGLRAEPSTGDFIVEESKEARGFINVAGIKSPGLTASPAIAEYVVELLKDINGGFKIKEDFNPIRERMIRFDKLSDEDKAELIKKDSRFGRIICRCENITEGEIVDAIRRKVGATTVDGIKKRVRPGMGRCQGGFCSPRVMEILARELGTDVSEIVKDSPSSYVLVGRTNKGLEKNLRG